MLVVQVSASHLNEADENRVLVQLLADALDADGRVNPVAWSLNDRIFRSAVDAKLVSSKDNPDVQTIIEGAEKLRTEYVLIVTVFKKEADILARAKLLKKGLKVWSDPEVEGEDSGRIVTVVTSGKPDITNSLRSAVGTWVQLLGAGPLKGLDPHPRIETPPLDPGVKPEIPPAPPVQKVDNKQLMSDVMKLLAAHKTAEAIAALRDAVDAEPLDVERRKALTNTLATSGMSESAAGEARRAAELFPDQVDFRTQAARLWMAANKPEEASKDLNEAVARNPESVETRLLLGEVALGKLMVDDAIAHFDFVISKSPTGDCYFKRALAKAFNDDPEGCKKDLQEANKLGLGKDPLESRTQYDVAIRVSKAAFSEMGTAMKTLIQRARANFGGRDVRDDHKSLTGRCQGLSALYEAVPVPPGHKNSHEQRVLALKLLLQALGELGSYLDSGSDDTVGDATITLGEALKAIAAADEAYKAEVGKE